MSTIYLTGAPATGKSTLCRNLEMSIPNVVVFSYSQMLRDHLRLRRVVIDEEGIRRESANAITADDVKQVDAKLLQLIKDQGGTRTIVVDSHPVTKEAFGFRITPFTQEHLRAFSPDKIFCLYAAPDVLRRRISNHPEGRPIPSDFELCMHVQTQVSLAATYAAILGHSCYLLESSGTPDRLLAEFLKLAALS